MNVLMKLSAVALFDAACASCSGGNMPLAWANGAREGYAFRAGMGGGQDDVAVACL